jgi:hypothetical protein
MDQKRLVRTVDGFQLSLVVTEASASDIVIWMHGITVNKDEYLGFFREGAHYLAQEGFTSIRFDFRGHGESSGSSLDFSVVGQNLDVKAVIDYANEQIANTRARLHLVAASFGAPPAIFAGARYPDTINSISLISPVLSYKRTFLEPETEWAAGIFTEEQFKALDERGKLLFDQDFWIHRQLVEEMRIVRPDVGLRELRQPVLVFHGDKDSMVPYDVTAQVCRGVGNVKLVTMFGVDHGFMLEGDEEGMRPGSIENKLAIYRQIASHIRG